MKKLTMIGCLDCGVVQGSKLSGLLYTIYTHEFPILQNVLTNQEVCNTVRAHYYENLPDAPPWFNKNQRRKLEKFSSDPHPVRIYKAERTAFGPQAFTYFSKQTGDYEKALSPDYLYPVPFQLNDVFYDPYGRVEGHFTENTLSVHLYTNGTKPWWKKICRLRT